LLRKYFDVTEDASKADYAVVFVNSPSSGTGYSREERLKGGIGYIPISLQYGRYIASKGRAQSIASGDPILDPTINNRTYKDKVFTASNITDLQAILDTKKLMGSKPVIVVINASSPMVFKEFENEADAIVVSFGVQNQAILDILQGNAEPKGLLPITMPANMEVVESQLEDVAHDMQAHQDSQGNLYKFGFGLSWKGVIRDSRTTMYKIR
jgi:beta-glucosidase